MTYSTRLVAIIATLLSTLSGSAFAASRTDTSIVANLRIQVNVVQVIMTNPEPKATPERAVSYNIPTAQLRMSVSKEIRKMQATGEKAVKTVEVTTIVAE
ncbi:MAG: hypothetical protein WCG81_21590 [Candidatus Angelobacter sp.]